MSQKVPMSNFKWVEDEVVKALTVQDIMCLDPNSDTGFVFEIDAEIPQEIHDR